MRRPKSRMNIHLNISSPYPLRSSNWMFSKSYPHQNSVSTLYFLILVAFLPITVPARSKAWTVFAGSNIGIVGSNPTWGMDVCVRLFCIYVVLCEGSGLVTDWSPVQGSYWLCIGLRNWKSGQGPEGCRSIERVALLRIITCFSLSCGEAECSCACYLNKLGPS
jgi:hypothetical protein